MWPVYVVGDDPGALCFSVAADDARAARSLTEAAAPPPEVELRRRDTTGNVRQRLGQGTFRVLVTEAYDRRCAVTRERTLPALQAAHIRPSGDGGQHDVAIGLLLRNDIHLLVDHGYVTVTPEHRFEVSRRIREELENGRDYYALHG